MNYHCRHYCRRYRWCFLISWIFLSLVQGLDMNVDLSQDYVNHFGTDYNNTKGHWKLARDCTKGRDSETICIPPKGNILCDICRKIAENMKIVPHSTLLSAKFFQGNLTFPETVYQGEMRIDIIKCRFDVYAYNQMDETKIFHITRGKEEKSAYMMDSYYKFSEVVDFGYCYFLCHPYIMWE